MPPGRACRKIFGANSERPGRGRPTRRKLSLFRHRDQAFALGLFPSCLARAPDGFRLLAGLALGRLFIRLAALHLTKNALALHLLLEDPERLIDIVVANDDLQNVSNLLPGAGRAVKLLMKVSRSTRFEILRRLLAAVADQLVLDHLAFVERGQAGALDRGDMDEYVFAAVLRLNESIALGRIEPFHGAGSHLRLLVCTNLIATAHHRASAHPKSALPMERHTVRCATKQGQARISGLYAVPSRDSTASSWARRLCGARARQCEDVLAWERA